MNASDIEPVVVLVASSDEQVKGLVASALPQSAHLLSASKLSSVYSFLTDVPVDILLIDEQFDGRHFLEINSSLKQVAGDLVALLMMKSPLLESTKKTLLLNTAFDILSKPLDPQELQHKLKKALERALLLRKVRIAEEREKAMNERIPARLSTAEANHAPRYSLQQFFEASASLQDMLGLAGQLLHSFSEHFMVGKGAVVVFDEGADKLEVKACRGLDMEFLQEVKFNPHAGIYHWLRKHHRLLFLKELTDIPELDELALIVQEAKLLQAEVVAPLAGKTYPVGFLSLGGKFTGEPYSPEERENLFLLSRYAGGTIENALVFERTRGMAIRDELTQLYNRHYWKKSLAVEVERSKRYVRPLSVVIFDIDYFKAINDTRGHQAGDEVLKALARHLVKSSRHTDVLGRYGGEEFIAILPETVAELAYLYCERVRQDVEQKLGKKENAEFVHPGLTISGGMTTCDQKNDTPANIIERADRALYSAKREGRNRIHQAPPP